MQPLGPNSHGPPLAPAGLSRPGKRAEPGKRPALKRGRHCYRSSSTDNGKQMRGPCARAQNQPFKTGEAKNRRQRGAALTEGPKPGPKTRGSKPAPKPGTSNLAPKQGAPWAPKRPWVAVYFFLDFLVLLELLLLLLLVLLLLLLLLLLELAAAFSSAVGMGLPDLSM